MLRPDHQRAKPYRRHAQAAPSNTITNATTTCHRLTICILLDILGQGSRYAEFQWRHISIAGNDSPRPMPWIMGQYSRLLILISVDHAPASVATAWMRRPVLRPPRRSYRVTRVATTWKVQFASFTVCYLPPACPTVTGRHSTRRLRHTTGFSRTSGPLESTRANTSKFTQKHIICQYPERVFYGICS